MSDYHKRLLEEQLNDPLFREAYERAQSVCPPIPGELTLYVCEVCGQFATDSDEVPHVFGPHLLNKPAPLTTITYDRRTT